MIIEIVAAAACVALAAAAVQAEDITLTARLAAGELTVGESYRIDISLDLGDGWSTADAGIPTPMLQFDVPANVKLSGKVLETYRELSRNEFLNAPFERQFDGDRAAIEFTLTGKPDGETIGVNLVAYARHEDGRVRFIRRRVDLPLTAGAHASSNARSDDSSWGHDMGLQIGDKATTFDLPRANGSTVNLDDYLGNSNIIVTTYRAYW